MIRRSGDDAATVVSATGWPTWPLVRTSLVEDRLPVLVAEVDGELDMVTAPDLQVLLLRTLEEQPLTLLVVDLTHVRFLAAAGIAALLRVRARARELHVEFRVVGSHRPVTRPLYLLGLVSTLDLRASRELALSLAPAACG